MLAACSSATPATVREPVPAPAPVVDAAPAAVDAAASVPTPAAVFAIPARLPEHGAVVLAEQPGGTVTLHPATGADITLADGESVTLVDESSGVGQGDATATIEARGVRGQVPNARIVDESRIARSPDGHVAIFSAIVTCGDFCHSEVWWLGPAGARSRVTTDGTVDRTVSWRPDGTVAAVGSGALYMVRASDGHTETDTHFTAPAYAPDGALFVRGAEADDAVFALADGAPPRRVFAAPGRVPPTTEAHPATEPTPVVFEDEGRVLRATFDRGARQVTARAGRDGRPAPAPDPGLAETETFARAQIVACNAERVRLHESEVFPSGTTVRALRRVSPRVYAARFERPGVDPVEVHVDLRTHHIQSPGGARTALGGGLDFCPPAVWLGPQND